MLAIDIISDFIPPLKVTDDGVRAIEWMHEFKLSHLPLIDGKEYVGLLSENDLLDHNAIDEPMADYINELYKPYVLETDHIYEVIRRASEINAKIVPVVDAEMNYKGVIPVEQIIHYLARLTGIHDPGGVIVIDLAGVKDYSLSDIARIVEANNAVVLSLYIDTDSQNQQVSVTLKLNTTDIKSIVATFERYKYNVRGYFNETDMQDVIQDRYDALMNYLNI